MLRPLLTHAHGAPLMQEIHGFRARLKAAAPPAAAPDVSDAAALDTARGPADGAATAAEQLPRRRRRLVTKMTEQEAREEDPLCFRDDVARLVAAARNPAA